MRTLGFDPVHDTQTAFRALCDATSRPGSVVGVGAEPADHAILATLVDHEVTAWTDDDRLRSALDRQGRFEEAPPTEADVVHTRGSPEWDVRECTRGTLVEPSEGATVVYRVEGLAGVEDVAEHDGARTDAGAIADGDASPTADPDDAHPTTVVLGGPGVDGSRRVSIGLPAAELEALAEAQSTYPRGVDAYFAADGRVAAIPRSSELEVA